MDFPMRSRGKTIYKRDPSYTKCQSSPTIPQSSKYTPEYVASVFDTFGPMSACKGKDAFSGDYQQCSSQDNLSTASTSIDEFRSRGVSRISVEDFLIEEESEPKTSKLFRAMVIGTQNADKLSLVNAICPVAECDVVLQDEVKFDLVTRTIERENMVERYHFWLKEAGYVERKHRALLNVYYRTCSAFFLVYKEDDKMSFDSLENEVEMIKEANGDKEVLLVLICNKDRRGKCRVSQEDVQRLVEKCKIQVVLEGKELFTRRKEIKEVILCLMK